MVAYEFDVVVVGGGLFGCIITRALRTAGLRVELLDDARPMAGSPAAACLMRPSWFSSLGKAVYEPALALLDRLYGLQEVVFKLSVGGVTVNWVSPEKILSEPSTSIVVRRVSPGLVEAGSSAQEPRNYRTRTVIVAAGIWTGLLLPGVEQRAQLGAACLWDRATLKKAGLTTPAPRIKVWAPYKQLVVFDRGDGVWAGDGSALNWASWTPAAADKVEARCREFAGFGAVAPKRIVGVRPYVGEKPCLLKEVRSGVWAASGGAKNGTLAAGWAASELLRKLA